jgi:hypothetical protein
MAITGIAATTLTTAPLENAASAANRVTQGQAQPQRPRSTQSNAAPVGAQPLNSSGPRGTRVNIIA